MRPAIVRLPLYDDYDDYYHCVRTWATTINSGRCIRRPRAKVRRISTYIPRSDATPPRCRSVRFGPGWVALPVFSRLAGSDHYGRPSVVHSLGCRGRPTRRAPYNDWHSLGCRQLFYGSSATSNQRLIIQRGNCATSVYDRATRYARDDVRAADIRRWCVRRSMQ